MKKECDECGEVIYYQARDKINKNNEIIICSRCGIKYKRFSYSLKKIEGDKK